LTSDPATKRNPSPEPRDLLASILEILDDHKAEDVVVIDLHGKSTIGDYMVVATGRSSRQVSALAETLIHALKIMGVASVRPEGIRQGDWVLIDAGDVIVHLFRPDVREFYSLEKMWEADFSGADRNAGAVH
jgi:ribosome-associated protein